MALQLAKCLKASNNIIKKEFGNLILLDEMRYIRRQLRLLSILAYALIYHFLIYLFVELIYTHK